MEEQEKYRIVCNKEDHDWFSVVRLLQTKARSQEGFAAITTSILCDKYNNPKVWLPPIKTLFYPKKARYNFLAFMEEYNVLRSTEDDYNISSDDKKYNVVSKPQDIRHDEWLFIISDLKNILSKKEGCCIVTITVICNGEGKPVAWPDPIVTGLTKENASEKMLRFLEGHNVLRRRYSSG